jgi:hypothetical protein
MATQQAPTQNARARLLAEIPAVERRVTAAGISTAVLEGGDGAPLVLLHGPAANAAHWMRVIPDLVQTHRVIAPDLPGHGASEAGDAERMLAWLGELIEATCPRRPRWSGSRPAARSPRASPPSTATGSPASCWWTRSGSPTSRPTRSSAPR